MLPDNDRGRPVGRTAPNLSADDKLSLPDLDRWSHDVIRDALNEGRRLWWLARAEDFERSKPRREDFDGGATREQLRARWRWCHETAKACRNKAAAIAMTPEEFDAEIDAVLNERTAA